MMKLYADKKTKECIRHAEQLLTVTPPGHLVVPVAANAAQEVGHAEQAVALLEDEAREMVVPENFPQAQLDDALWSLQTAQDNSDTLVQGDAELAEAGDGQRPAVVETCSLRQSQAQQTPPPRRQDPSSPAPQKDEHFEAQGPQQE
ncbi:hypothetical protein LTR08_007188 [Meristemomyces frigidus]|nr:hypothetical protein LTR08_007188 [Meristemomyces frigidus]